MGRACSMMGDRNTNMILVVKSETRYLMGNLYVTGEGLLCLSLAFWGSNPDFLGIQCIM